MSALLKAKQETLALRLAALSQPAGGSWVSAARADALARLQAMGLPGRRDVYWRHTDPAAFNAVTPAAVTAAAADAVVRGGWAGEALLRRGRFGRGAFGQPGGGRWGALASGGCGRHRQPLGGRALRQAGSQWSEAG